MSRAVEQAYSLGLLNFSSSSIAAACVCFFELLGVCSLKLRVDLKALNLILRLWSQNCEDSSMASLKQSLGKAKKNYLGKFSGSECMHFVVVCVCLRL